MGITQRGSVLQAADAAANDLFGSAVALSADGTIKAVGAQQWEGGSSNQGGVYIYDWSGSAWVARGSVLVAADAASDDYFGSSVSLSDDGSVLAVGATGRDISGTSRGGVYIYDWSGSAWVQRGSVLTAADADINDNFGSSLALSASGSVLAVGARAWEGSASNQGGVYIYDWTTVWTQRGSVLVASDAAADDTFGYGVALSDDGAILAVGAANWEGSVTNQGAVYLYDWSGSAWTERSGIVTASDAASGKTVFGTSVALSASGTVLAVGAIGWDGGSTDQGAVYLYDWSGSAWVERAILTAGDAAASDNFGSSVALSDAAGVMVVGAINWEGSATNQGGVYVYDITVDLFKTASLDAAIQIALSATASISGYVFTTVFPNPLTLIRTASLNAMIYAAPASDATIVAASLDAVIATAVTPSSTTWTVSCLIDSVDVSARMVGQTSVTIEEGAARIAELTILPTSGAVDPLDYVGKPIVLDYVILSGSSSMAFRLFTGRVDTPSYDPSSTLLRLTCVDDLQNRVALLTRSEIDDLIGGLYTEAVQGKLNDNWDYAKALLTTVQDSFESDELGVMRLTPWQLDSTWETFDESDLIYDRSSMSLPQRSTLVNKITIDYEYRYQRLRQRYTTIGWSGTHIDMAPCGYQYPTQQDIAGAAGGSGWTVTLGIYYPAPATIPHSSGGVIVPQQGAIDMAIIYLTQRHSQTVSEAYTITVTADESVTLNGEIPGSLRGALESSFDGTAWESALDIEPLMPTGGDMDYSPDATRTQSDYAIQTLLDQANTKIAASHRSARVGNAVLLNPDLDVDKKVSINTSSMAATGKVAKVIHVMDLKSGSAISEFEIAISGAGGAGIITPDTLDPPAPPAEAVATHDWHAEITSLYVQTYGVTTYSDNLMGLLLNPPESITVEDVPDVGTKSFPNPFYVAGSYPVTGFRVRMPGVTDADRNPISKPVTADYSMIIPNDTMTFTVP